MIHAGQHVSSVTNQTSINFRTINMNKNLIHTSHHLEIIPKKYPESKDLIEHKIFNENGAPFIYIQTNLCERPLKLLIDTGAAISLLASDVVENDTHKIDYIVNLFGIIGKDISVKTEGMIHCIFTIDDRHLGTTLHLINRKHAGPADGYLGYDFLCPY